MRALLILLVLLPASAQALKCKRITDYWTPGAQLTPESYVIARTNFGGDIKRLVEAKPAFVGADGVRTPATVESIGNQAIIRPGPGLKGTVKLVGENMGFWAQDQSWTVVEHKAPRPEWTGDPKLDSENIRQMGRYGASWHRTFAVPVTHANLIHITVKQPSDAPTVRFAKIEDGKMRIGGGPCGNLISGLKPGIYDVELRPVAIDGALGAPKSIRLHVPSRRSRP